MKNPDPFQEYQPLNKDSAIGNNQTPDEDHEKEGEEDVEFVGILPDWTWKDFPVDSMAHTYRLNGATTWFRALLFLLPTCWIISAALFPRENSKLILIPLFCQTLVLFHTACLCVQLLRKWPKAFLQIVFGPTFKLFIVMNYLITAAGLWIWFCGVFVLAIDKQSILTQDTLRALLLVVWIFAFLIMMAGNLLLFAFVVKHWCTCWQGPKNSEKYIPNDAL